MMMYYNEESISRFKQSLMDKFLFETMGMNYEVRLVKFEDV